MLNIDCSPCIEPNLQDIQSYLRKIIYSEFALEWQQDETVIAELQNAASCIYANVSIVENSVSIKWGTTYTSSDNRSQSIIDWILNNRIPVKIETFASEELSTAIEANSDLIIDAVKENMSTAFWGGG